MNKKLIIICGIALFLAGSASASPTIYTSRAAWETAVSNSFWEEKFDDTTLHSSIASFTPSTSGEGVSLGVWRDRINDSASTSTITFNNSMNAFGGDWDLFNPTGPGTGIKVYMDGTTLLAGEIANSYAGEFWGFVSDTNFTSIVLKEGSNQNAAYETYELDNMVWAPAPGAILLSSIGVALVGWLRRRRTL